MSMLASLVRAFDRLPDAPAPGYSMQEIGVVVGLREDGSVASVTDIRDGEGRKKRGRPIEVPQPVKRSSGIAPNLLWDKTAYVLGVTIGEGKRTAAEHAAFIDRHEGLLAGTEDIGLLALLRFLRQWRPDAFVPPLWSEEMKDQNVVFALEAERLGRIHLHDRPAAKRLIEAQAGEGAPQICLVTGERAPVARLHPSIKGVWGGQSSGASLVSFNLDAFTSYGHEQGDNAPVSEAAAFKYTAVLNRYLERRSGHRVQIGDASTVFWADASDIKLAEEAEAWGLAMMGAPGVDYAEDEAAAKEVGIKLDMLRKGKHLAEIEPRLAEGVRFHVLGLAPNAARLSVRFYFEGDFGVMAENYRQFIDDLRVSPPPREVSPPISRYLIELAVLRKRENLPPNLAGEWMRAILSGMAYPETLLATTLMRIRADGELNALRAGILKALLIRNHGKEVPVALDREEKNKGYLLGRLFATYEEIQRAALGGRVNATIKDKFYASASATPRKVFSLLESGSANHLSKLRKLNPGREVNLQKRVNEIMDLMEVASDPFPASFSQQEQAFFGLGYHHQNSDFYRPSRKSETEETGETA